MSYSTANTQLLFNFVYSDRIFIVITPLIISSKYFDIFGKCFGLILNCTVLKVFCKFLESFGLKRQIDTI